MSARAPAIRGSVLLVVALHAAAAVGALAQGASTSPTGRMVSGFAAVTILTVATGVMRRRMWAVGASFLIGVFWLWAAIGLTVQQELAPAQTFLWVAWSFAMIAASLRARNDA